MKNTAMNSGKNVPDNSSGGGGQPRRSSNPRMPMTSEGGPRNNVLNDPNTTAGKGKEFVQVRQEEISRSLPVPEYKIGWIIGKRGSYINQLAEKSGASVSISDSSSKEYGTIWKYVQLRGSGRAVDRAKKLLHIRLERLEPRPTMNGGDGDGYGDGDDNELEGLEGGDFEYGERKVIGEESTEGDAFQSPSYNRRVGYGRDSGGDGGGSGIGRDQSQGGRGTVGFGRGGGGGSGSGRDHGNYGHYSGQYVNKSHVGGYADSLEPQNNMGSSGSGYENQQKNQIQQSISKEES